MLASIKVPGKTPFTRTPARENPSGDTLALTMSKLMFRSAAFEETARKMSVAKGSRMGRPMFNIFERL